MCSLIFMCFFMCVIPVVCVTNKEGGVVPDDDKRYAIETCRSSEKCFKKVI